jgi:hypothetical protein
VLSTPPLIAARAFFPEVVSRSQADCFERKLPGWKPWTCVDNRATWN